MEKKIYIVRHCEAEGQPPNAALTKKGMQQAVELAQFFSLKQIDRIISSHYLRAIQSIEPLAKKLNIKREVDERLSERILSSKQMTDWLEKLRISFENMDISYGGGESSNDATKRGVEVVQQVLDEEYKNTVLVTHGNLMALLLKHFDGNIGFEEWKNLSNPDVYCITFSFNKVSIEHIWNTPQN